jgi:hypothetical protein
MRGKKPKKNLADYYKEKYSKSLSEAKATGNDENTIDALNLNLGKYTLKSHISRSPWLKSGRPATKAIKWLYQEVFKNPDVYRHNRMLLNQGNLYMFEYKNPKYKDTLDFYDKFPLVLALGPVSTKLGIRNIGFNLHLLPIKIRVIVLCLVFDFFKRLYRYQIFHNRENRPVNINYGIITKKLERYGVKFCVRMYIPNRQRQIVKFGYKDWAKAIFIPSRGYSKITAPKLLKAWKDFNRKQGFKTNPNMSWQTIFN